MPNLMLPNEDRWVWQENSHPLFYFTKKRFVVLANPFKVIPVELWERSRDYMQEIRDVAAIGTCWFRTEQEKVRKYIDKHMWVSKPAVMEHYGELVTAELRWYELTKAEAMVDYTFSEWKGGVKLD